MPHREGAVRCPSDYASTLAGDWPTDRRRSVRVGGESSRKAGVKHFVRHGMIQCLVRTNGVVFVDIVPNCGSQFPGGIELADMDQFRFQTAESACDPDVVHPTGFSVHALPDVQGCQQLLIRCACELTALV